MGEKNLKDKVVVITGGATGIGYHIADKFLNKGSKIVILLDINQTNGELAKDTLTSKYSINRVVFIKCDVTADLETVYNKILDKYNTVDVLVNNAGVNEKDWEKCLDINIKSVIAWTMKFWSHMRKDKNGKGGTILNVGSIYSYMVVNYAPVYTASKFAVLGFTRSLGHPDNYKRSGVRVLAICPGFTKTNIGKTGRSSPSLAIVDDDFFTVNVEEFRKKQIKQEAETVGAAAVDVFERGDSGSAWLSQGGRPIKEVVCDHVINVFN